MEKPVNNLTTLDNEELVQARILFRSKLNPESYQTLLDRMFNPLIRVNGFVASKIDKFLLSLGRFVSRKSNDTGGNSSAEDNTFRSPPFWLYVLLVQLLFLLLDFSISALANEFKGIRVELIPLELFNVLISFSFVLMVKGYFDRLIRDFRDDLVDFVNSINSLKDIRLWFEAMKSTGGPILWGGLFSLFWACFGPLLIYQIKGGFLGWGPWVLMIIANFPIGTGGYYLWISRNFRIKAKTWDFKIYEPNPSKSLIIAKLSKLLSIPVTIGAILSILVTFAFSITRSLSLPVLIVVVISGWYPMLSLFVRNQIALTNIITRAKDKKLFELQNQINEYEKKGLRTTQSIEYLQKLMDYHDRIASTPNTALNFRITFGFFNTLLLPLLTVVLTNISAIISMFK
jgi:hypothetical protein